MPSRVNAASNTRPRTAFAPSYPAAQPPPAIQDQLLREDLG